MIAGFFGKVKEWRSEHAQTLYIGAVVLLVGVGSFGLGRLSIIWPKKEPIEITTWGNPLEEGSRASEAAGNAQNSPSTAPKQAAVVNAITEGKYVASRKGTSYHYPWCPGAKQIKEENKIYFNTKEEAEKAGYKPAGNCEGL